jgi:hypothetical protein
MTELNTEHIAREAGVDESVVSEIATRLSLVRGNLTDARFSDLIHNVVKTKLRFAERDAREDLSLVRMSQRAD